MTSEKKNFFRNIYPMAKLAIVLFVVITTMFTPGYTYQYLLFPIILLLCIFTGIFKKFVSIFMKTIFILVIFIFVMQSIIFPGETIIATFGFINVNLEGLMTSLNLTSKIIAISSIFLWFFLSTKNRDFIYSLEKAKMPKKPNFVILSTLQMFDQLKESTVTIMNAQQCRGIEVNGGMIVRIKSLFPIITPLVLSNIEVMDEKVLTLEARGFSLQNKKTSIYFLEKKGSDKFVQYTFLLLTLIYLLTVIF